MSNDFKPGRTLTEVRDDMQAANDHVAALLAEMHHHALIVADQHTMGGVDEQSAGDYLAARERWEKAVRDLDVARTRAVAECSLRLIDSVLDRPRIKLAVIQGGA